MLRILSAFLLATAISGLGPPAARADITVAVAGPMSGTFDVFGAQMKAGAEQAVSDINAAGGVLGEMLVLDVADDACDPKQAVAVANQMAGKRIALMAGHFCSAASIPAAPVYAAAKIIQISPASSNPKFTDERAGPGTFRIVGRDDRQGSVAGAFVARAFPDAAVATVDDGSNYGQGLAVRVREALNAAGKTEVFSESFDPEERDFTALANRLRAAGIDVLYVGATHTSAALIAKAVRDLGLSTQIVTGDAAMTDEFWSVAEGAAEGALLTYAPDPRKDPANAELVERFRAKGIEPEGYVIPTYAAIWLWAEAARKAASTEFDAVAEALSEERLDSPIGAVRFDGIGDATLPGFVLYRWHDGRYDYARM